MSLEQVRAWPEAEAARHLLSSVRQTVILKLADGHLGPWTAAEQAVLTAAATWWERFPQEPIL